MEDKNEQVKIKEARYLIIIPLLITVVCAWLDFFTNYAAGAYAHHCIIDNVLEIIRLCMGYFFPSLLSIVVAMIWQQGCMKDDVYGLREDKIGWCVIATVFYSVFFVSCLIKYNLATAITFCIATVIYGRWIYVNCLNEKIKFKNKKDMTEEELLKRYVKRISRRK